MNYCNWHLGDYASHTGHLSPLEDLAYRRALDWSYLHEKPLPRDPKAVARELRLVEHEAEVRTILRQFFDRTPAGYTNKRVLREVAKYRAKVEAAAQAGRTSAERRANRGSTVVERTSSERSTTEQPTKNQEPRTSTTPTPPSGGAGPGVDRAAEPEPEQSAASAEIALQEALGRTGFRAHIADPMRRRFRIAQDVPGLLATGLVPGDVDELWRIAQEQAPTRPGGDAGALLAHWLDENLWREVLDAEGRKAKERAAERRTADAAADDPLAGVYGA